MSNKSISAGKTELDDTQQPSNGSNPCDEKFMLRALELGQLAASEGEVPVGAVVVCDGEIVAEASNCQITACDPTAHAEILALREAARLIGNYRLIECELYVTLEPCAMCAGAMVHSRIKRLIYAATEPKAGVVESNIRLLDAEHINHHPLVTGGVLAAEAGVMLSEFFKKRRAAKKALRQNVVNSGE